MCYKCSSNNSKGYDMPHKLSRRFGFQRFIELSLSKVEKVL